MLWVTLTDASGNPIEVNLAEAVTITRVREQTSIRMAVQDGEGPLSLIVKETPAEIYAKAQGRGAAKTAAPEQQSDAPLLDLIDPAVKRFIRLAKKRGYVTYDEVKELLPSQEFTSVQIEDVLGQLSEMGINVVPQLR